MKSDLLVPRTFFSVSALELLPGHFYVIEHTSRSELKYSDEILESPLPDTKLLYVACSNGPCEGYIRKNFLKFQTKLNKCVYQVDLAKLIGRLEKDFNRIYLSTEIKEEFFCVAKEQELNKIDAPLELVEGELELIQKRIAYLESTWLNAWKTNIENLRSFCVQYPIPQKSRFKKGSLFSIFSGSENSHFANALEREGRLHDVCVALGENLKSVTSTIGYICPRGCGYSVEVTVLPDRYSDEFKALDFQDFPNRKYVLHNKCSYHIYDKVHGICASCEACGVLSQIENTHGYTCILDEYNKADTSLIASSTFRNHISFMIDRELYGWRADWPHPSEPRGVGYRYRGMY